MVDIAHDRLWRNSSVGFTGCSAVISLTSTPDPWPLCVTQRSTMSTLSSPLLQADKAHGPMVLPLSAAQVHRRRSELMGSHSDQQRLHTVSSPEVTEGRFRHVWVKRVLNVLRNMLTCFVFKSEMRRLISIWIKYRAGVRMLLASEDTASLTLTKRREMPTCTSKAHKLFNPRTRRN